MEIQFHKTAIPCLRRVICQVQTQEQTQEVRLPEGMPDIGRILGCWGQVLIRSKEWRSGEMAVSGGVMARVLYAPEDGTQPGTLETWIPFQMKWDFPETQRDGFVIVAPSLKGMDARSVSARKLMVRANISVLGQAMEPVEPELWAPGNVPEDVQILTRSYPVELPRECGEKLFSLDEEIVLPGNLPPVERMLRCELLPQVTEQKVLAGRLLFRGKALLHLLYSGVEGAIHNWDMEIPYSQFAELDRDYSGNATGWILPVVTALEIAPDEQQRLQLKSSIAAQYTIFDRVMVEAAEDAYSPNRKVQITSQELMLPMRLDRRQETLQCSQSVEAQAQRILDICWLYDHAARRQNGDSAHLTVPGQFQILYQDTDGNLQTATVRQEESAKLNADPGSFIQSYLSPGGFPQGQITPQTMELMVEPMLDISVFSEQGLPMLTGLELGEAEEPDAGRPSLILRRAGEKRLWDIAKECGSTVDAIRKANKLQEEPEFGQMLLIPVS